MSGWIKLHRTFSKWGWKTDPNMVALWIHILTNSAYEEDEFLGIKVSPGQLITGRKKLSKETGISEQTIRTCLRKLKSTNEVTIISKRKYSIITVTKWNEYQCINQEDNQQLTNSQPTTNQQLTTTKEVKNIRNKEVIYSMSSENDVQKAFDEYNTLACKIDIPKAQILSKSRKAKIKQRLIQCGGIDGWSDILRKLSNSNHCKGNNDRGWKANLDFILQESSFIKLMEGYYDDRNPHTNGSTELTDEERELFG